MRALDEWAYQHRGATTLRIAPLLELLKAVCTQASYWSKTEAFP
jgi:hypothetical protein